ncbi:unnamed protein product [Candida parapsilosis]
MCQSQQLIIQLNNNYNYISGKLVFVTFGLLDGVIGNDTEHKYYEKTRNFSSVFKVIQKGYQYTLEVRTPYTSTTVNGFQTQKRLSKTVTPRYE